MTVVSLQLAVYARPLLGPSDTESPETRHSWYERIINYLGWSDSSWEHHVFARGPIFSSDEDLVLQELLRILSEIPNKDRCLLLDLSSHRLRSPAWDAVSPMWTDRLAPFGRVVIIFDHLAAAIDADTLVALKDERQKNNQATVIIDASGVVYDKQREGAPVRNHVPQLARFDQDLNEEDFRNFILREAWRRFGHFVTPSGSHVRTHYDLYPIVRDDRALRYLTSRVRGLRSRATFDLIIGFGLGSEGLIRLCDNLAFALDLPQEFYTPVAKDAIVDHLRRGSTRALLVTDVVLTGSTATQVIEYLRSLGAQPSQIMAVIGLRNSVSHAGGMPIEYCVRLNRPFYQTAEACPICASGLLAPTKVASVQDFYPAVHRDMTPYDLWELIKESSAFELKHTVSPGGFNHYLARVHTEKMLNQFGEYIAEVLAARVDRTLGHQSIDVIACPKESGALRLAYALAVKLRISPNRVIGIGREDLEKCSPAGVDREVVARYENALVPRSAVLAVDDGVNTLHTFVEMTSLLGSLGCPPCGYAALLNSLSKEREAEINKQIGRRFVWAFHWDLRPFSARNCPLCRLTSVEVA